MSEGEIVLMECGICGKVFHKDDVEYYEESLYGITNKRMRCPYCKSNVVYYKNSRKGGRYTNAYSYISSLKA